MKAIEFQSQLTNGKILVPPECGLENGQDVRVLILVDESVSMLKSSSVSAENIWDQVEGSWQGDPLVREEQGGYPERLELK